LLLLLFLLLLLLWYIILYTFDVFFAYDEKMLYLPNGGSERERVGGENNNKTTDIYREREIEREGEREILPIRRIGSLVCSLVIWMFEA